MQGDIIKIVDTSGNTQVQYLYDAWGYPQSITGNLASTLGQDNPYRYRGYRYDNETGLYYLQSRYYNPVWGRFINADSFGGNVGGLLSHNLFAYCNNDPVNFADPSGHFLINIFAGILGAAIGAFVGVITTFIADKLDDGCINTPSKYYVGAAVGGAVTGAINGGSLGSASGVADYAGAAAESATVEVYEYASGEKALSWQNVGRSTAKVVRDTAVNGTINRLTGVGDHDVAPINKVHRVFRESIVNTGFKSFTQTILYTVMNKIENKGLKKRGLQEN